MNLAGRKSLTLALPVGTALIVLTPVYAGPKLVMNGKTASTDVRVINGKAYAPVADMAKALSMVVVKRSDGYEIKKAGGATPVQGLQGKVGDVLFDGRWRFQVLSPPQIVESYIMKTNASTDYSVYRDIAHADATTHTFTPLAGYKLVAIPCRVTNARNIKQALLIGDARNHTALADMSGGSHEVIAYDVSGGPWRTKELLPGAKEDMVLLFAVPLATQLKDLIFTLRGVSSTDASVDKYSSDVRVSLTP
ncbi:MAG: hypothetical protein M3347_04600 [Armatimonadota bacterium]|nr:hypothetical protein [Armatimonadota bacterium]